MQTTLTAHACVHAQLMHVFISNLQNSEFLSVYKLNILHQLGKDGTKIKNLDKIFD